MMRINPVKLNNVKQITFGEGNLNNITPNVAILSLQNNNAKINFENDLNRNTKSDVVQNPNMFNAIGAKLRKAYNILFSPNHDRVDARVKYISYMA